MEEGINNNNTSSQQQHQGSIRVSITPGLSLHPPRDFHQRSRIMRTAETDDHSDDEEDFDILMSRNILAPFHFNQSDVLFALILEEENYTESMAAALEISMQEAIEMATMRKPFQRIKVIPLFYKDFLRDNRSSSDQTSQNFQQCTICLMGYKSRDRVCSLDCKHLFHSKCIKEWGKYKSTCPTCRCNIPLSKPRKRSCHNPSAE